MSETSEGERWWTRHGELLKTIDSTSGKFEVYDALVSEIRADERSRLEQVCGLEKRKAAEERTGEWFECNEPCRTALIADIRAAEDNAFHAGCEVGRELAKGAVEKARKETRAQVLADYSATEAKAREDERELVAAWLARIGYPGYGQLVREKAYRDRKPLIDANDPPPVPRPSREVESGMHSAKAADEIAGDDLLDETRAAIRKLRGEILAAPDFDTLSAERKRVQEIVDEDLESVCQGLEGIRRRLSALEAKVLP